MGNVDKRNRLDEEVFAFRLGKDGRVVITWYDKAVKTLVGAEAARFLQRIEGLEGKEAQLVMAKVTGNFKRGNERVTSARH